MTQYRTLRQVLPRKARDNHVNCSPSDAISFSDCSSIEVRHFLPGIKLSYCDHVALLKLGCSLSFSARPIFAVLHRAMTPFRTHIIRVVSHGARKQMGRIHASRRVASMADIQSDRQRSVPQHIGNSVREPFLAVNSKCPVTVAIVSSAPEPAAFRFVEMLLKTSNVLSRKLDAVKRVAYAIVSFFHIFGMIKVRAGTVATTISSLVYYNRGGFSCNPKLA